jgi:hypothetical protein
MYKRFAAAWIITTVDIVRGSFLNRVKYRIDDVSGNKFHCEMDFVVIAMDHGADVATLQTMFRYIVF